MDELLQLENEGLVTRYGCHKVHIKSIICDAPARSFIKNVKTHNAYFGCERCARRGSWLNHRVIYTEKGPRRLYTDQMFKNKDAEKFEHSNGDSPLERTSVGLISKISLDYMHLCCLGTMKKLLLVWTKGRRKYRLSRNQINEISERIVSFRRSVPKEFSRKPRGLDELSHWKATEYRTFLLYIGPMCLLNILYKPKYKHFLLFHTAIYILVSKLADSSEWVDYAQSLLEKFVSQVQTLYYKELLVYNMHSLLHLGDDVKLDQFSAFEFENYMQPIKRMLRANSSHLSQVVKRISEIQSLAYLRITKHSIRMLFLLLYFT